MSETREIGTHLGTIERQVLVDGEWVPVLLEPMDMLVEDVALAHEDTASLVTDAPLSPKPRGRPRKS